MQYDRKFDGRRVSFQAALQQQEFNVICTSQLDRLLGMLMDSVCNWEKKSPASALVHSALVLVISSNFTLSCHKRSHLFLLSLRCLRPYLTFGMFSYAKKFIFNCIIMQQ